MNNIFSYITELRTSDTKLPKLDQDVLSSIIEFKNGVKSQNLAGKKFQFDDKLSENFLKYVYIILK